MQLSGFILTTRFYTFGKYAPQIIDVVNRVIEELKNAKNRDYFIKHRRIQSFLGVLAGYLV